jgi:hypothetical protein
MARNTTLRASTEYGKHVVVIIIIIIKKVLIKVTLNAKALQGHCTHENDKVRWSNVGGEQ